MKEAIITYREKPDAGDGCFIVDWRELVRCKDCKHYAETQQGKQREINRRYVCDDFNPPDDFFCADGERKE